jgi:hypothetical protein
MESCGAWRKKQDGSKDGEEGNKRRLIGIENEMRLGLFTHGRHGRHGWWVVVGVVGDGWYPSGTLQLPPFHVGQCLAVVTGRFCHLLLTMWWILANP